MTERRCSGCNDVKDTKNFIKLTKDFKTQEILINPNNFHFGRSMYVCKCENCINAVFKKDRISRYLKKNLTQKEKENIRAVLNAMVVVQQ